MAQENTEYLIGYVNYVKYIITLFEATLAAGCRRFFWIDLCDDSTRKELWENVKKNIFDSLLSSDEIRYLSGGNSQKVNYFVSSEVDRIVIQTCQSAKNSFKKDEIISENLKEYELQNYDELKKAYLEFIRLFINRSIANSSNIELNNIKKALHQILDFIRKQTYAFKGIIFSTKAGTKFVLKSDINLDNVPDPDDWGSIIRGIRLWFPCNVEGREDTIYVFPAPMFTNDFINLIEELLLQIESGITQGSKITQVRGASGSAVAKSSVTSSPPQPLTLQVTCTAEEIRKAFPNVRDPLEAAVAYAFKLLGFDVRTNVSRQNRAGHSIEVDVIAEKGGLEVYASCKNFGREIDRSVVDEEYGRVSNLKKIPHLKVLVTSSMTPQAKETAESDGFIVIELGMNVTEDNIAEACREVRDRLGKYFETLAPPELVSAYSALQGALSTLRNVEKEIEKAIESLQRWSSGQGSP